MVERREDGVLEVTEGERARPEEPPQDVAPLPLGDLRPVPASALSADPESGELVFISLWETAEDLEASENSGYYEEQLGRLSSVLAGQAAREAFEAHVLA